MRMRPKRPILRAQIAAANPAPLGVRYGSGTSQAGARGPSDWILPCWNLPSGEECCLFENPDEILCGPAARRMRPGSIANVCPPGQVPMNGRCVAEVGPQLQYGQRYSNPRRPYAIWPFAPKTIDPFASGVNMGLAAQPGQQRGGPFPTHNQGTGILHRGNGTTRSIHFWGYRYYAGAGGGAGHIWVNLGGPGSGPLTFGSGVPDHWVRASYFDTPPNDIAANQEWVRIMSFTQPQWGGVPPSVPPSNIPVG